MGLFSKNPPEPKDTTAIDYLSSAPPGARTEVLSSACILQTCGLEVAAASKLGSVVPYSELVEAERLVQRLLHQDTEIVATVARKAVFNVSAMVEMSRTATTYSEWMDQFLASNGIVSGHSAPLAIANGLKDPDGTALNLADLFWMTFRAVTLGSKDAEKGEWGFYSSLYTDPEKETLAYSVIAWGAIAVARLINSGALDTSRFVLLQDAYKTIPPMSQAGWYPHPKKASRLPDGDAQFKCYWDGVRWTDRVRLQEGGRWQDHVLSLHAAPDS